MKQLILTFVVLICLLGISFSQDYYWEGYTTTYSGGHQTANDYSSFTSHNWFQSSFITDSETDGYSGFLTPTLDIELRVDLKVFLEGVYEASGMSTNLNSYELLPFIQPYYSPPWHYLGSDSVVSIPNENVIDWLLIEFRDATESASANATSMIERKAAFLLSDGSVVDMDGINLITFSNLVINDLFIVIHHRNHLSIMSVNEPTITDGIISYDFTSSDSQVHGGDLSLKENTDGTWSMAAGDCNSDGFINTGDKIEHWTTDVGLQGYLNSDLNMNGQTDNVDKNDLWLINFGMETQVPKQ